MKNFLLALLFVCGIVLQGQTSATKLDTLSKTKLSSMRDLREFLPELPSQFKSVAASLVIKVNENTYEVEWTGLELSSEALTLLKSAQVGTKFYLDVKLEETSFRILTHAWKITE